MNELVEAKAVIDLVKQLIMRMEKIKLESEYIEDIEYSIEEVNLLLYNSRRLKFQKSHDLQDILGYREYINEIKKVIGIWEETLTYRQGNECDVEFYKIYESFKYVDADAIYNTVLERFMNLSEEMKEMYLSLPKRYTFLKGKIDYLQGDFSLIREHVDMMSNNIDKYKWLYERLADNRSKKSLNGIIQYWFDFDIPKLHTLSETMFRDYYDLDILQCNKDEVMIDLGAYTGDSIIDFINTYGQYKRIYAYEITPSTYKTLTKNLEAYPNIVTRQKGVGGRCGVMYTNDIDGGAGNKVSDEGDTEVEIVTLDEDVKESITIIKMDIEGAEKEAIRGATGHIQSDKPKMLISSYHLSEDIFDVPSLINSIRGDYKYYMRFNGRGIWPCDYILFAI